MAAAPVAANLLIFITPTPCIKRSFIARAKSFEHNHMSTRLMISNPSLYVPGVLCDFKPLDW
jgi:hypothetical protein